MRIIPNPDLIIKIWDKNEPINLLDGIPTKKGCPREFHIKRDGAVDDTPTLVVCTYCQNPDGSIIRIAGEISFRMLIPVIDEMKKVIDELRSKQ